ncbi:MAG: glycosyltransferase family 1 protein [Patescibacteria group bacterium]
MQIIVDLRALAGEQISGVKIYLQNLLAELARSDKKNRYFLWFNSATEKFPDLAIPRSPRFKKIRTRFSNRVLNLKLGLTGGPALDELILASAHRSERADLFWLPDPRPVALSANCKLVATFHDLAPMRFPQFFSRKTQLWHKFINLKKIARKADRILAVSEFTRSELESFWHIPAEKIAVTPLAAKISPQKSFPKNLPKRFILALSTLEPRKNLPTLLRAFAELQQEKKEKIELLIAGEFDSKIFADPAIVATPGVRFLGKISEEEKAGLLARAEVFCFPSLYEGFGLPPLEAAAAGRPILAADIPPLREILGDAAQFIAPQNRDAWCVGLAKILASKKLQRQLSRAAKARAKNFSWQKTARKTLKAFENAVK